MAFPPGTLQPTARRPSHRRLRWVAPLALLVLLPASAQEPTGPSGTVFGGIGASTLTNTTVSSGSFGIGGEYRIRRLGLGGEFSFVQVGRDDGLTIRKSLQPLTSVNATYHFRSGKRGSRHRDPYVTAGVSFINGSGNFFHYGAGLNYWFDGHTGMRFEIRDNVNRGGHHLWQARVGFNFR